MKLFEGLKFKRKDSFIHKLDPRVKFIISCVIFAMAIIFTELIVLLLIFIVQVPIIYYAKVQKEWAGSIRSGLFLTAMIFIINILVGFLANNMMITKELFYYSLSMAIRFVTLMSSFSIFFLTTSPDDLSLALEQIHIPYEFCFAFTTAIRFVPVLATETQTIIDAQKSRGLELEKGNFMKKVRNYIPILIPLIISAIRRSLELAEAMESRAFGSRKVRTSLYLLKLKIADYLTLIISFAILSFSIYVKLRISIPSFIF